MTTTLRDAIDQTITVHLRHHILPTIVDYIQSHRDEVITCDHLMDALSLQQIETKNVTKNVTKETITKPKKPSPKSKKKIEKIPAPIEEKIEETPATIEETIEPRKETKLCTREFKRKTKGGPKCTKPAVEGSEFCRDCAKQEAKKKTTDKKPVDNDTVLKKPVDNGCNAVPYGNEKDGLFVTMVDKYILKEYGPEDFQAVGKLEDDLPRKFTEEEIKKLQEDGVPYNLEFDFDTIG